MDLGKHLVAAPLLLAVAVVVLSAVPVSADQFDCSKYNSSCSDCTGNTACYWCSSTKLCLHYPGWTKIIPHDCPNTDWYYGQCRVAGNILIIVIPSVAGAFLVFLCCCVYCCCCRRCNKCKKKRFDKEDAKLKRKREEMQALHAQRKGERDTKRDEIRKKYGLRPGTSGYQKIEEP